MRVSVGDVELYVHERGRGRALVALHGGPGLDGSVWFPASVPAGSGGVKERAAIIPRVRASGPVGRRAADSLQARATRRAANSLSSRR